MDDIEYEFVFSGRVIGSLSPLGSHKTFTVRFRCTPSQATNTAWKALLDSGAYETHEHFVIATKRRIE